MTVNYSSKHLPSEHPSCADLPTAGRQFVTNFLQAASLVVNYHHKLQRMGLDLDSAPMCGGCSGVIVQSNEAS